VHVRFRRQAFFLGLIRITTHVPLDQSTLLMAKMMHRSGVPYMVCIIKIYIYPIPPPQKKNWKIALYPMITSKGLRLEHH